MTCSDRVPNRRGRPVLLFLCLAATLTGCGAKDDDFSVAKNPKEAASQLETAFSGADPAFEGAAGVAADALRKGEYVEAVESLQTIKASQNVTVNQGLAVHSSIVQLETALLQLMEAGDPRAKAAYERLKAMKSK